MPKPAPKPAPAPVPKPTPTPTPKPKPLLLPKRATDTEKREYIKQAAAGGAFAWQQGKLHGKPVWHIVVSPFTQQDKITVLGKTPEGATIAQGKGQAYKSITMTRGTPPAQPVKLEGGAIDPVVSPIPGKKRGVTISFVPEKEVYRKGNIRIVERPATPKEEKATTRRGNVRVATRKSAPRYLGADIVVDKRGRHIRLA
jgi:outer membrane biosynthesis protein TonB